MSRIHVHVLRAQASLTCDRCGRTWKSAPYTPVGWHPEADVAAPAFASGWRMAAGPRNTETYCPEHGPTIPRHLLKGIHAEPGGHGA
jgi:hypothetical protein